MNNKRGDITHPLNYLFLAPKDVKKLSTQRQRASPREIAAKVMIQIPSTLIVVVDVSLVVTVSKKMPFANVDNPPPTPVAIPDIPLVRMDIISVTRAVPVITFPNPPYLYFAFFYRVW